MLFYPLRGTTVVTRWLVVAEHDERRSGSRPWPENPLCSHLLRC